jgi:heme exporter protein D
VKTLFTRDTAIVMGLGAAALIVSAWWSGVSLIESINALVLGVFWFAVVCAAIRTIYLPVQYLRHRAAVMRWQEQERRREADRARYGFAVTSLNDRDPQQTPWYRW